MHVAFLLFFIHLLLACLPFSFALLSYTCKSLGSFYSDINTAPTISNLPAEVYKDEDINGNSVIYTIDKNDPDSGDSVTATITVWPAAYASKFSIYQGVSFLIKSFLTIFL